MFSHQIEGVSQINNILGKHSLALLADEPGLGKTVQAIKTIQSNTKTLVIVPPTLLINWKKEINYWSPELKVQIVHIDVDLDNDIFLVSYSKIIQPLVQAYLDSISNWDYIICDEAHKIKNPKSKRSQSIRRYAKKANKLLLITGTPIPNKPIELYSTLQTLLRTDVLHPYSDYKKFGYYFCKGRQTPFCFDVSGSSNEDKLNKLLRESIMVRRTKDLLDLPPKIYSLIQLERAKNKKLYKRLDEIDEYELYKNPKKYTVGELATLRRQLGISKLPLCIEYIKDLLETTSKLVIFAHHREVISTLQEALSSFSPLTLTGSQTIEQKQFTIDSFQNTDSPVIICQLITAGVGVTLTKASHVVFVEPSYVPSDIEQASDRCHRIGQNKTVNIDLLVTEEDLDCRVLKLMLYKQKMINRVLNS